MKPPTWDDRRFLLVKDPDSGEVDYIQNKNYSGIYLPTTRKRLTTEDDDRQTEEYFFYLLYLEKFVHVIGEWLPSLIKNENRCISLLPTNQVT